VQGVEDQGVPYFKAWRFWRLRAVPALGLGFVPAFKHSIASSQSLRDKGGADTPLRLVVVHDRSHHRRMESSETKQTEKSGQGPKETSVI